MAVWVGREGRRGKGKEGEGRKEGEGKGVKGIRNLQEGYMAGQGRARQGRAGGQVMWSDRYR